ELAEPKLRELARELRPERAPVAPRELVHHHPARVVPSRLVLAAPGADPPPHHPPRVVPSPLLLAARVAEPHDEKVERRAAVAPTQEAHGLLLGSLLVAGGLGVAALAFGGLALGALGRFLALRKLLALGELGELFLGRLRLDFARRHGDGGQNGLVRVVEE